MGRVVKKPEERRQEILKTARRLFQTKDYEQVTTRDVMESLGIAKGTIYHYFKSKRELLEAVVDDMVEERLALMEGTKGNALEKMQQLIERGNLAADEPEILDHLHRQGNEALHVRLLAVALAKLAPLYAQIIQQGCEEGLFHTESPLECAEFILAGFQFLTDGGLYPWTEGELARRAQAFPCLIEQQLQAPPGSFDFLTR